MGMNLAAGGAAGAGGDALQELLKQKFLEQITNKKLAEDQRQADMQNAVQHRGLGQGDRRLDLEGAQQDQAAQQFGQRLGLDTRKLDVDESQFAAGAPMREAQTGHLNASTADLTGRPAAEQAQRDFQMARDKTQHGYQLGEIGAQNAGAVRLAGMRQQAAAGGPAPNEQQQNEVSDSLALINEIRNDPALAHSVGPVEGRGGGMVTAGPEGYARVKALHDNLVGKLQLAQAGKLKGQGAVSDAERMMLKQAATALDRTLGDPDYLNQLTKIEQQFQRLQGGGGARPAAPAGAAGPSGGKNVDPLGIR